MRIWRAPGSSGALTEPPPRLPFASTSALPAYSRCLDHYHHDEHQREHRSDHRRRVAGAMAMKLTASMMLTLDGVYQGPGGPDEDRRGGFERGGWTAAHADEEMWPFLISWFERADALLLGRKTWEIWEPYWPHHDSGDPVSHGINVLPKYVPSTTLKNPTWQNTHVIDGDVEAAIRELKAKPGRELQLHGSGVLLR